jgi:transmembrane sensor
MDTTNFDDLLQRYLDGKVTPDEKKKIEAWLEVRKNKNATDLELSKDDEEKLFQKIVSKTTQIKEVEAFLPGHKTKTPFRLIAIAASVAALIVVSLFLWPNSGLRNLTDRGREVTKIILNDGTIVWLKHLSTISYYEKDGLRYALLKGNALFEVAKDPAHPFVIACGKVNLKVLGTSFSVDTHGDSLELKVLTGKVQMFSDLDPTGIQVSANEKALFVPSGRMTSSALTEGEKSLVSEGTEYTMTFNNSDLAEVLNRIESKFDVEIRADDVAIKNCRITADFTDQSLQSTLAMISEVLAVEFKMKDHRVEVTGPGCSD